MANGQGLESAQLRVPHISIQPEIYLEHHHTLSLELASNSCMGQRYRAAGQAESIPLNNPLNVPIARCSTPSDVPVAVPFSSAALSASPTSLNLVA
eukprot:scaffold4147_cov412-Prasinococcus_capsulatus_cf.AAC.4